MDHWFIHCAEEENTPRGVQVFVHAQDLLTYLPSHDTNIETCFCHFVTNTSTFTSLLETDRLNFHTKNDLDISVSTLLQSCNNNWSKHSYEHSFIGE